MLAVANRIPTAPFMPKIMDPPIRNKQDASIFMATSASLEDSYWHNSFLHLLQMTWVSFLINDRLVGDNILGYVVLC